jgi:hypothetical protein
MRLNEIKSAELAIISETLVDAFLIIEVYKSCQKLNWKPHVTNCNHCLVKINKDILHSELSGILILPTYAI